MDKKAFKRPCYITVINIRQEQNKVSKEKLFMKFIYIPVIILITVIALVY